MMILSSMLLILGATVSGYKCRWERWDGACNYTGDRCYKLPATVDGYGRKKTWKPVDPWYTEMYHVPATEYEKSVGIPDGHCGYGLHRMVKCYVEFDWGCSNCGGACPTPRPTASPTLPPTLEMTEDRWVSVFRCDGSKRSNYDWMWDHSFQYGLTTLGSFTKLRICTRGDYEDCVITKAGNPALNWNPKDGEYNIQKKDGGSCNLECIRNMWEGEEKRLKALTWGCNNPTGKTQDAESRTIYMACNNAQGLHMTAENEHCEWDWGRNDQKLEIQVLVPAPTGMPTTAPTAPTMSPTMVPSWDPTPRPTAKPTVSPTSEPTAEPTANPTNKPTELPTAEPTVVPTNVPTELPTAEPTDVPTSEPTDFPTAEPTVVPTSEPTDTTTVSPSAVRLTTSEAPTVSPDDSIEEPMTDPTTAIMNFEEFRLTCAWHEGGKKSCLELGCKYKGNMILGKVCQAVSPWKVKCKKIQSQDRCLRVGCAFGKKKGCKGRPQNLF